MKILIRTNMVSGGNQAVAAAAVVITSAAAIGQSFEYFIDKGEQLGDKLYSHNHPDDGLGKMIFTKDDFKQPNWYLPSNQHPNNFNADSFHGSFGGF